MTRLSPYNKPLINVIIGIIMSCIQGCIFPVFGIFITKMLFSLMQPIKSEMREMADEWCLYMFLCAVVCFITNFSSKFSFGVIGENITFNIRQKLYAALLKRNLGWFDLRDNAPGILTSVLSSDV